MPIFVFQVEGHSTEERVELSSIAAAKCEAVRFAGRLICDEAERFWDSAEFNMTVSDDSGLSLFTLDFRGLESPAIRGR